MKQLLYCAVLFLATAGHHLKAEPFNFVALGDMPYGDQSVSNPIYEKLIDAVNKRKPAFVVHLGDTLGGIECSNRVLNDQLNYLNSFQSAAVYVPGDNEWTDCHRDSAGNYDPVERLAYIRKTYFADPSKSFGANPFQLESQASEYADHFPKYVENTRFSKNGVLFIQAHVVGSNNNLEARSLSAVKEFFERDEANLAWLISSFNKAHENDAKAVVLAIHADMFEFGFGPFWNAEAFLRHSGFKNFGEEFVRQAVKFKKPILLIYGDSHKFRIWRPFPNGAPNITAMEVFGAQNMHAVEVSVDPQDSAVFGFKPVLNPSAPWVFK